MGVGSNLAYSGVMMPSQYLRHSLPECVCICICYFKQKPPTQNPEFIIGCLIGKWLASKKSNIVCLAGWHPANSMWALKFVANSSRRQPFSHPGDSVFVLGFQAMCCEVWRAPALHEQSALVLPAELPEVEPSMGRPLGGQRVSFIVFPAYSVRLLLICTCLVWMSNNAC